MRVDGIELVVRENGVERRAPIGSLAESAEFVGPGLLAEGLDGLTADPLEVDPQACAALAAAFALARSALERLRSGATEAQSPTAPTLWPEHFDLAIEMGEEAGGRRANYGLSPGDENHAEPYFYVGPRSAPAEGDLWNASGFAGAQLAYAELAEGTRIRSAGGRFQPYPQASPRRNGD